MTYTDADQRADTAYLVGYRRGGEDALTGALHPEFGTEWREPDGVIWKAAQEAKAEAWDEAVRTAHDLGWLHDFARSDALGRNPYR
jgi:hypothetical protein